VKLKVIDLYKNADPDPQGKWKPCQRPSGQSRAIRRSAADKAAAILTPLVGGKVGGKPADRQLQLQN
jgi:hypothetical protein